MKVEFFGQLAELAGAASLDVSEVDSVVALKKWLGEKYPSMSAIGYMVAVNKKMAEGDISLSAEDHIALMPPFSGG